MRIIFKVEDFLKIEKAEIDITNFCVFIGNNNSGKTKLMELIYGVLHYLSKKIPKIDYRFRNNTVIFDQEKIQKIINFINDILEKEREQILQSIFNKEMSIGSMQLDISEVDTCYEVIKATKDNMNIFYEDNFIMEKLFVEGENVLDRMHIIAINTFKNGERNTKRRLSIMGFPVKTEMNLIKERINSKIMCDILDISIVAEKSSHLFFPASRMGLAMLYKEYFNSIGSEREIWIGSEDGIGEDTYQQSDHVTKPVLDYLRFLQGYSFNISMAKKNADLIDFINEYLLEGTLNEQGEMALYTPKDSGIRVPLYLASSMINELDPIIKMLTNRGRTKMLFYDEIETSLHPLKQLEMVKLLNRLNNNGMRIILTTHSDTFVTKLNNLLLLSRSEKIDKDPVYIRDGKIEISREDLLKTDDIHIYQFINKDNGRSEVSELEFRTAPMVGYSFDLFEDSSTSLFEETKLALGVE